MLAGLALAVACRFDPAYRDTPVKVTHPCVAGTVSCRGEVLSRCNDTETGYDAVDDCGARGLVCAQGLLQCTKCSPGSGACDGQTTETCAPDGGSYVKGDTCDPGTGVACRGGVCLDLCQYADDHHSNIGCEYWAADLDNAVESASLNAAAQQFAVVVSNAEADVATTVTVDEDDAAPGDPPDVRTVATATIAPQNLEVFKLGPREVDGSPDGEFNTGTGTALTRHAFRVRASMPIVAYQFNPLENVNVFSNDASQLLPVSALSSQAGSGYVVLGWPQTIARSDVPTQNFGQDLRAFVAVVGTRPDTHVHLKTAVRIIPGGPFGQGLDKGGEADVVLQPFEVLNLETGEFKGDFTGSTITADGPVAVFPGSEASDAPFYDTLADRFCCADHLEEQLAPARAVGKTYALAHMPTRSKVVAAAGGNIGVVDEPEYFRVMAVGDGTTHVKTTLPPPQDQFDLAGAGADRTLVSYGDFLLTASQPAIVMDTQASQDAAGVPRGLPGGDPSITFVAPIEQWRGDYVLLTPDKYDFDFLVISAPFGAHVYLDGLPLDGTRCDIGPGDGLTPDERGAKDPPFLAYRCQLSYPQIDPTKQAPDNIAPGKQNDGVHHVQADEPVGVVVYGFDSYVSYAYAGGTQLEEINVK